MLKADTVQVLPPFRDEDERLAETEALASLFFLVVSPYSTSLDAFTAVAFGGNLVFRLRLCLGPAADRMIPGELTDFWGFNTDQNKPLLQAETTDSECGYIYMLMKKFLSWGGVISSTSLASCSCVREYVFGQ